jgi:hypothetical protein
MPRQLPACLCLVASLSLCACGASKRSEPAPDSAPDEVSATARALERLSSAYADLADHDPGEAVQWAQDDFENLGDWEYRVVEFAGLESGSLESELNALGGDRWEVFWVENRGPGVRVYLKRPAISVLSKIPLSTLLRLLPGGGQE